MTQSPKVTAAAPARASRATATPSNGTALPAGRDARTLLAFYGSVDALELSGAAIRLFGEWIVSENGASIAATVRRHRL